MERGVTEAAEWFPDGVAGRDPGTRGNGILNPASFFTGESDDLSADMLPALIGDVRGVERDGLAKMKGFLEPLWAVRSWVNVDNLTGCGSAGRSTGGIGGISLRSLVLVNDATVWPRGVLESGECN